ncbi:hypothetical protein SAMN06265222_117131 [Neorhodopirellula lusitana]|uniref:Transmembrane protein n=1 Tax=Neorhodopirellula lusitana TaxID=445327 RepID=A0ABY1QPS4_9BACT|nr:hypothetical protein [Neorhodopirellula lusitana]SMP74424.1 hypothetical protein SAMN06265222_117131 [Neorhodopirellula lusitana]
MNPHPEDSATPPRLHIGWKIYACTIGTVLIAGVPLVREVFRERLPVPSVLQAVSLFLGLATGGFILGLLFSLKDYFEERHSAGQHVPFPFRQAFCGGLWSLFLFWVPLAFAAVIVILAISIHLQFGV